MPKPFIVWITANCGKFLDGNTRPSGLLPEKSVCRSRSKLELNMEQQTGSKSGRSTSRLYTVTLLLNLYAEYIMQNARLDETKAGIKMAGKNINNLRYAGDNTLAAESKEELKTLLMKMKESEKVGLKLNIQKSKIMASGPVTSWQIDAETMETDYIFGFQNHCRW